MPLLLPRAQIVLHSLLCTLLAQSPTQSTTQNSQIERIQLSQDVLCCFTTNFVEPIYPKEARLAHTEGVVKLMVIIADDGSIADLQAVSGDPLLLDSTMKAVRQWRFTPGRLRTEREIPLSFTFRIVDAPKPAYLHLTNKKVIRADKVVEFTDRIEYTVGHRIHRIASDFVTDINACARVVVSGRAREGDCIPSGGPSLDIRAIPLLAEDKDNRAGRAVSH